MYQKIDSKFLIVIGIMACILVFLMTKLVSVTMERTRDTIGLKITTMEQAKDHSQILLIAEDQVYYYEKKGTVWHRMAETRCTDNTSVASGDYAFSFAFGTDERPATRAPYKLITEGMTLVSSPDPGKAWDESGSGEYSLSEHKADLHIGLFSETSSGDPVVIVSPGGSGLPAYAYAMDDAFMSEVLSRIGDGALILVDHEFFS